MINTTVAEDRLIYEAKSFGGKAADLVDVIARLDQQLTITNVDRMSLEEQVTELRERLAQESE